MDYGFTKSIENLPPSMKGRATWAIEHIKDDNYFIEWNNGLARYWVEDTKGENGTIGTCYSSDGHYSNTIKKWISTLYGKEEVDKVKDKVIAEANQIWHSTKLYQDLVKANENWDYLKSQKTGACLKCGKECKTHLHHLDKTLIPETVINSHGLDIRYSKDEIILQGANAVAKNFIDNMGDNPEKTIRYLSVKTDEVIELCPKCHRNMHKKGE